MVPRVVNFGGRFIAGGRFSCFSSCFSLSPSKSAGQSSFLFVS